MKLETCYRLAPNRVWRTYLGGRTLDRIAGVRNPEDSHFPEDWLLSTTAAHNIGREKFPGEGISRVITSTGEVFLTELAERFPEELFGRAHR